MDKIISVVVDLSKVALYSSAAYLFYELAKFAATI